MAGMTGDPPFPIFFFLVSNNPLRSDYLLKDMFPPFAQMLGQPVGRVVGPKLEDRFRPYVIQWNLNVQHQLSPNTLLELGYGG